MSKLLTIKNIASIMGYIASEHKQINTILRGNLWDVDLTKDVTGVYLIFNISNIVPNGFNGVDYSVDIFICDNVSEINSSSNSMSVQNECSLIGLDIMSIFKSFGKGEYADKNVATVLGANWSIQPFEERFDSLYSGVAISLTLSSAFGYVRCDIPTNRVSDGEMIYDDYQARIEAIEGVVVEENCAIEDLNNL